MHTTAVLQKLAIGYLVFELLKLKFGAHILFDGLFKVPIKCILDEVGGVVGATPEGMGHHFCKV